MLVGTPGADSITRPQIFKLLDPDVPNAPSLGSSSRSQRIGNDATRNGAREHPAFF